MNGWGNNVFAALVFLFSAGALIPSAAAASSATPILAEQTVVARIDGEPIYAGQLEPLVEAELRKNRHAGEGIHPDFLLQVQRKALNRVIETELLVRAAEKLEIPDLDARIAAELPALREKMPDRREAEVRELARRQLLLQEYLSHHDLLRTQPSEAEIQDLYERQRESLTRPETVRIRQIFVRVDEESSPQQIKKARERIETARRQLVKGKPFTEVAQKYSQDEAAQLGGEIGFVQRGFMPAEFDQHAFSLPPGQISEIVQTPFGFHVLEVLETRPAGPPPLEEIRDFLGTFLQERKGQASFLAHLRDLRAAATVEILLGAN